MQNTCLWGQPLQIFWSEYEPPRILPMICSWFRAFNASSMLSTRLMKNSTASCCSRRFTGSPCSLPKQENTNFSAQWRKRLMVWNHLSIKSKTMGSNSRLNDFDSWSDLWVGISTESVKPSPLIITKASECNKYQSLLLPSSRLQLWSCLTTTIHATHSLGQQEMLCQPHLSNGYYAHAYTNHSHLDAPINSTKTTLINYIYNKNSQLTWNASTILEEHNTAVCCMPGDQRWLALASGCQCYTPCVIPPDHTSHHCSHFHLIPYFPVAHQYTHWQENLYRRHFTQLLAAWFCFNTTKTLTTFFEFTW